MRAAKAATDSVPIVFTSAADPEDIERTCVKFRVFKGTDVMVL